MSPTSLPALVHRHGLETAGKNYRVETRLVTAPKRYLFQATLSGEGLLTLKNKSFAIPKGKAIFVPVPGNVVYTASGFWRFVFMSVKGEWAENVSHSILQKFGSVLTLPSGSRALATLLEAAERAPAHDFFSTRESAAYAVRFLLALLDDLDGPPPGKKPPLVAKAMAQVRRHFAEPLTAARLADGSGQSREHFTRTFMRHVGLGPAEYILRVRLGEAASLLTRTDLAVGEVALRTGFSQTSAFTRAFKRHFGAGPAEWRKNPL